MKHGLATIGEEMSLSAEFLARLQRDKAGFALVSRLLHSRTGIQMLPNEKNLTLMATRLVPILKARNLASYRHYFALLERNEPADFAQFVSALTTNTTHFFREDAHFKFLGEQLGRIMEAKRQRGRPELRVWCSAASTGQEVYSILMLLLEKLGEPGSWGLRFLATDIDFEVLERAATGCYSEAEVANVPAGMRKKYFNAVKIKGGLGFQIREEYRALIRFAQFNLLTPAFPFQFPFDIIFCRNVLIYFDRDGGEAVVRRLANALGADGHLFLGHSETGLAKTAPLKTLSVAVYQKKGK